MGNSSATCRHAGIGNVTAAYKAAGLWDNTVLILVSDNGGPLDHTTNAPLRGGKHTFWEGGVRVVAFVSGPLIPVARRGTEYLGMLHSSDWYPTVVEGIAGGKVPAYSGPTPVDGFDVWAAILGNATSPRTEVIHQVKSECQVPIRVEVQPAQSARQPAQSARQPAQSPRA